MAIPNPFRRLKAATSTVDELSTELGRLDRIRLDAQNTLHDLGAKRPGLLIDGTDVALAKLDAEMAAARRALEQAEARIALITPEWQEADRLETEARAAQERRERYAAAVKARAEGVKLLAEYERDAQALAGKLSRLRAIGQEIDVANLDLPTDAAPIGGVEAFNGRHATPDTSPSYEMWVSPTGERLGHVSAMPKSPMPGATRRTVNGYGTIPGAPGVPHRGLLDRVALPALDPSAAPHWSGELAGGPRLSEAAASILRFHGVSR